MQFVYKLLITLSILGAISASAYIWHKAEVRVAVEEARTSLQDSYRIESDEARKRLQAKALASEKDLKEQFADETRIKDEKINSLNANFANLLNSVRNRPERSNSAIGSGSAGNSSVAEVTPGSTGAKLFREDSEFLIGEAARAELIRSELQFCYAQYDNVWRMLKDYSK